MLCMLVIHHAAPCKNSNAFCFLFCATVVLWFLHPNPLKNLVVFFISFAFVLPAAMNWCLNDSSVSSKRLCPPPFCFQCLVFFFAFRVHATDKRLRSISTAAALSCSRVRQTARCLPRFNGMSSLVNIKEERGLGEGGGYTMGILFCTALRKYSQNYTFACWLLRTMMEAPVAFSNLHLMCSFCSGVEESTHCQYKGSQNIHCSFLARTGTGVTVKTYRRNVFESSH